MLATVGGERHTNIHRKDEATYSTLNNIGLPDSMVGQPDCQFLPVWNPCRAGTVLSYSIFPLAHCEMQVSRHISPKPNVVSKGVELSRGTYSALLDSQLDSSQSPVLSVVVASREYAGSCLGLVLAEDGQNAKDDGDTQVQLGAHEAMGHGIRNVLEVHRLALDQHPDGNDGVKRRRGRGGQGGQVGGRGAQQITSRGAAGRGSGLNLRGRVHAGEARQGMSAVHGRNPL